MNIKNKIYSIIYTPISHIIGKVTKRYYFEDYVRVYPDGVAFNPLGQKKLPSKNTINNYLNHCKFYIFASQFVKNKKVADIGCGSGYGCAILKENGAKSVYGADISNNAICFAKNRYGNLANFSVQGITDLREYSDNSFDVTITSEVMEHIKEYGMEEKAINELKRITKPEGLIIIATPNTEMISNHGFSFDEIHTLCKKNFSFFCIFENALIPSGKERQLWEKRVAAGRVGIIISEIINLSESVLTDNKAEIKNGIDVGIFLFSNYKIDTKLLHNTHSWIVLAVNNKFR